VAALVADLTAKDARPAVAALAAAGWVTASAPGPASPHSRGTSTAQPANTQSASRLRRAGKVPGRDGM